LFAGQGKAAIFGKKTIARVDRLGAGALGSRNQGFAI